MAQRHQLGADPVQRRTQPRPVWSALPGHCPGRRRGLLVPGPLRGLDRGLEVGQHRVELAVLVSEGVIEDPVGDPQPRRDRVADGQRRAGRVGPRHEGPRHTRRGVIDDPLVRHVHLPGPYRVHRHTRHVPPRLPGRPHALRGQGDVADAHRLRVGCHEAERILNMCEGHRHRGVDVRAAPVNACCHHSRPPSGAPSAAPAPRWPDPAGAPQIPIRAWHPNQPDGRAERPSSVRSSP